MAKVVRFGVSMDAELLAAFDVLLARKGYPNRSEAIRDMVREAIVKTEWETNTRPTVGILCLIYDHQATGLAGRLTSVGHQHARDIITTLHVHLDDHNCLEVLVLRGAAGRLRHLADQLIATRGIKHGQLIMSTTGHDLP